MNWRVAGFAALGCGTLVLVIFIALAISGYRMVAAELGPPKVVTLQATQDPHQPVGLFSREQLQTLMPAAPAGSHLIAEQFHEAYCLDDCPTLTRTYDLPGGLATACAALVAIRREYLRDGYAEGSLSLSYPDPQLPSTVRACRAEARKKTTHGFTTEFSKNTSPTSKTMFTAQVRLAGDRFTIVTR